MYWKHVRDVKGESVSIGATDEYELPDTGYVTALLIRDRIMNSSTPDKADRYWPAHVTKIEVVADGNVVLYSLTGEELRAMYLYLQKHAPIDRPTDGDSRRQDIIFPVLFGRFYKDPKYLFDLSKFTTVELQITNDGDTSLYDSDDMFRDVHIVTLEEAPAAPAEFFKTYEYKKWNPASLNYTKKIDLPTLHKIRMIMIQGRPAWTDITAKPAVDAEDILYTVKAGFKEMTIVYLEDSFRRIARQNLHDLGLELETGGIGKVVAGNYLDIMLTRMHHFAAAYTSDVDIADADPPLDFDYTTERHLKIRKGSGTNMFKWLAKGYGYYGTLVIPFCVPDEPEWYYNPDVRKPGQIEINSYHASSEELKSGNVKICLQELHSN